MGKLTDVQVRNWVRGGKPVAKADGNGLTFTLSAAGAAAWILRYRFGGRAREMTIGRFPDIGLAKAREQAIEARAKIQQGVDVARAKKVAIADRAASMTFRELAASYKAVAYPRMAANTIRSRGHHIDDILVPEFGSAIAKGVSTAEIVLLIERIGENSISVAELVFTAASEIFKHGIARHAVLANPCAGVSVSAICGTRDPRKRLKLTTDELRVLLPALPSIGRQNELMTKILLATCARINELTVAKWPHLNFASAEWLIPESKASDRDFVVPLTPPVVGWFRELKDFAAGSEYVLPARQVRRRAADGTETHMEQRALNAMIHKLCDRLEGQVRRFTPHDLRSTARSHLSALGVDMIVAERCLNHSLGGLIAIYDRHDYLPERRAALEAWTAHILACEATAPAAISALAIAA